MTDLECLSCVKVRAVKHLVDLTIEDLTATPVWLYQGGIGAQALVIPARLSSLSRTDEEVFLAATEFTLPDSSRHLGFCFPVDDSGIDYLQPVILTRAGHVRFWFDAPVAPEILARQWNALGKQPEEVFPVGFRCLVPVDGRTVSGVISQIEFSPESPIADAGELAAAPDRKGSVERRLRRADGTVGPARPRLVRERPFSVGPSGGAEKRMAPRHSVDMMVEFVQGPSYGTGVIGDISRAGMFVRANRIPSTGPLLRLTVHLPEGRKLFLTGRVVRSATSPGSSGFAAPSGFGVRIADEFPDYEKFLSQLRDKPK